MNNSEKTPNYRRRRTIAAAAGLALTGVGVVGGKAVADRISYEHATVQIPPVGSEYKSFYIGETFQVGDKDVTIKSLSQASELAALPKVDSRATLAALESELPKGMDPSAIPDNITFRLPRESQIGDLHTGD